MHENAERVILGHPDVRREVVFPVLSRCPQHDSPACADLDADLVPRQAVPALDQPKKENEIRQ
jgi:hypothetical protein